MSYSHGMHGTATYKSWASMKNRCLNPRSHKYTRYGQRGISVCDEWLDFEAFFADMGERPDGTTLGRVDNDKGYCPSNCRWETPQQQANNKVSSRTIKYMGREQTLAQWSRETGLSKDTIRERIARGWSIHDALTKKLSNRGRRGGEGSGAAVSAAA